MKFIKDIKVSVIGSGRWRFALQFRSDSAGARSSMVSVVGFDATTVTLRIFRNQNITVKARPAGRPLELGFGDGRTRKHSSKMFQMTSGTHFNDRFTPPNKIAQEFLNFKEGVAVAGNDIEDAHFDVVVEMPDWYADFINGTNGFPARNGTRALRKYVPVAAVTNLVATATQTQPTAHMAGGAIIISCGSGWGAKKINPKEVVDSLSRSDMLAMMGLLAQRLAEEITA